MTFDISKLTHNLTNQEGIVDIITKYGISCSALDIKSFALGRNWLEGNWGYGEMRLLEPAENADSIGTSTTIDEDHIDESQLSTTVPTRLLLVTGGAELLKVQPLKCSCLGDSLNCPYRVARVK